MIAQIYAIIDAIAANLVSLAHHSLKMDYYQIMTWFDNTLGALYQRFSHELLSGNLSISGLLLFAVLAAFAVTILEPARVE